MSLGLTGDEDLDGVRGPAKAPVRDGGPPRMDSSVIRFAMVAAVAVHVESPIDVHAARVVSSTSSPRAEQVCVSPFLCRISFI